MQDEIYRKVEIDLTRKPVFSFTVESMENPTLYIRLQVPGLAVQPAYTTGYVGFEAYGYEGEDSFDIYDELDWRDYFEDHEAGVVECIINIWAYQTTVVLTDVRIEYFK